jgi:hypothetical protein
MEIKIDDTVIQYWTDLELNIRYDSLVSDFAVSIYFEPTDKKHQQLFKPLSYRTCTISDNGRRLLTGTVLSHSFVDGAETQLLRISGYSKTGVLEDSDIAGENAIQWNSSNLGEIANELIKPFGLKVLVDPSVADVVNSDYNTEAAKDSQTIKEILSTLASQKNVILTHDEFGNVLFTKVKVGVESSTVTLAAGTVPPPFSDAVVGAPEFTATAVQQKLYQPVFNFDGTSPNVSMQLITNGQNMHNTITINKQADEYGGDARSTATEINPYCKPYRPRVNRQTSGKSVDTPFAARNALNIELKNITLSIKTSSWYLGGNIARVNTIVTAQSNRIFLYKKTAFFVEQVSYIGNAENQTANLTCVLPEAYSSDKPINIFD